MFPIAEHSFTLVLAYPSAVTLKKNITREAPGNDIRTIQGKEEKKEPRTRRRGSADKFDPDGRGWTFEKLGLGNKSHQTPVPNEVFGSTSKYGSCAQSGTGILGDAGGGF